MITKQNITNYKGPIALIAQVHARRGGKLHFGVKKGSQGVSRDVRGVSKLLLLLCLIVREDIALTNRR